MLEYARGQFELDKPDKDGCALRDHLRQAAKAGWGRKDTRLFARCPEAYEYLWEWFKELHLEREFLPSGRPGPITAQRLLAWCSVTGVSLRPQEFGLLRGLDRVYLGVMNDR